MNGVVESILDVMFMIVCCVVLFGLAKILWSNPLTYPITRKPPVPQEGQRQRTHTQVHGSIFIRAIALDLTYALS